LDTRRLVLIGGVALWAVFMVADLITGIRAFLYLAILVIVVQVVLSASLRR